MSLLGNKSFAVAVERYGFRDAPPRHMTAVCPVLVAGGMHAALRADKPRRVKPNNLYDFRNASAALGYCNYFFAERPLRELIQQLGLEEVGGCCTVADLDEAGNVLRTLVTA